MLLKQYCTQTKQSYLVYCKKKSNVTLKAVHRQYILTLFNKKNRHIVKYKVHKMIQSYRTWYNQSRVTHVMHRWYDRGIAYPSKATLICSSVVPTTTSKRCYVKENDPTIKYITKHLNVIVKWDNVAYPLQGEHKPVFTSNNENQMIWMSQMSVSC